MIYDFAIIGGGIAGVSAAARLSELGSVILLEGEAALAYHASGRSAAMYEKGYGNPSVCALTEACETFYESVPNLLSPRGFLVLGKAGEEEVFAQVAGGLNAHDISLQEARALVPVLRDDVTLAGYEPEARDLDTDLLIQTYRKQALQAGAEFRVKAKVTGLTHAGHWHIDCGEILEARAVVNAAGAWADEVAQLAGLAPIGLQPYRRSMARVPSPADHDVSGWPMLYSAQENWYAKPDAGSMLVSPCEEDPKPPMDAWAEDEVLAEAIATYQDFVDHDVARVIANWAGLRSFAPDRTLVLGRDPAQPDFIWCAGQGGYGFQSADGASRLLRDVVAGNPPDLPPDIVASVDPGRFRN